MPTVTAAFFNRRRSLSLFFLATNFLSTKALQLKIDR
jgi:hypothetical protein